MGPKFQIFKTHKIKNALFQNWESVKNQIVSKFTIPNSQILKFPKNQQSKTQKHNSKGNVGLNDHSLSLSLSNSKIPQQIKKQKQQNILLMETLI